MTREDLKELVKQHFNLTEVEEKFDKAQLEDGSIVSNQQAGKFELGQILYIKTQDGQFEPAPEGEHVSDSGIQFILDRDSKIVGLKYPDQGGEGAADMKKDEDMNEEQFPTREGKDGKLLPKGEGAAEGAFAEHKDDEKMEEEDKMEEEEKLEDEKREDISMEEVIKVIGEVVEAKVEELEKKVMKVEEEMAEVKDKMSSFANEPAEEKTNPTIQFSAVDAESKNEARYQKALARLANKN